MTASIADGYVFGSTETVTSAKLQSQFTGATITNLSNTECDSVSRFMTNVSALPTSSLVGGAPYYLSTIDEIFVRNASESAWSVVPQMRQLTNKSGGSVARGDVIVLDTTTAKSFTTTVTAALGKTVGVVLDATIASNAVGAVAFFGYVPVNVNASTAIGDFLKTSTTAKKADNFTTPGSNWFGQAVTSSATQVMAFIHGGATSDFVTGIAKELDPRQRFYYGDDFTDVGNTPSGAGPYWLSSENATYRVVDDGVGVALTVAQEETIFPGDPGVLAFVYTGEGAGGVRTAHIERVARFVGTNGALGTFSTMATREFRPDKTNLTFRARLGRSGTFTGAAGGGGAGVFLSDNGTFIGTASGAGDPLAQGNGIGFWMGMGSGAQTVSVLRALHVKGGTLASVILGTYGTATMVAGEIKSLTGSTYECSADGTAMGTMTVAKATALCGPLMLLRAETNDTNRLYCDYWQAAFDR